MIDETYQGVHMIENPERQHGDARCLECYVRVPDGRLLNVWLYVTPELLADPAWREHVLRVVHETAEWKVAHPEGDGEGS